MNKILIGDNREGLKSMSKNSIDCIITSPPYFNLRAYGEKQLIYQGDDNCEHKWVEKKSRRANLSGGKSEKQKTNPASFAVDYDDRYYYSKQCTICQAWLGELGQEDDVQDYINNLCDTFDLTFHILKDEGSLWVNISDTYIDKGKHRKGMHGVPSRFMIEMINRGWICRQNIIWHKPNAMPTSVRDRCNSSYEHLFHFVKQQRYFYRQQYEPTNDGKKQRIMRDVWSINNIKTKNTNGATFPEELIAIPIVATVPANGIVMDIFAGSGTVHHYCKKNNINSICMELYE